MDVDAAKKLYPLLKVHNAALSYRTKMATEVQPLTHRLLRNNTHAKATTHAVVVDGPATLLRSEDNGSARS